MPQTKPEESNRGGGVPRSWARAASTPAPLSPVCAGTHTALTADPSPKSTTTATDVGANAQGAARATGEDATTAPPVVTPHAATASASPRHLTNAAGDAVARARRARCRR